MLWLAILLHEGARRVIGRRKSDDRLGSAIKVLVGGSRLDIAEVRFDAIAIVF